VKVLYIGGTGEISEACVARSVEIGHPVTVFNRAQRTASVPETVDHVIGDLRDDRVYARLADRDFDVVCQFLAYDPDTVQRDIDLFSHRCSQYVFISTASAYQKPHGGQVVTEATPLDNPYWAYSRRKAACELLLTASLDRLPTTIVRPSHTYRTRFPSTVIDGDHLAWRMLNDKPVPVHGDGESLWTLTHSADFACAFSKLLGRDESVGSAYHITNDVTQSWNDILEAVGATLRKQPMICPVATEALVGYRPEWEGPLLGDKAHSMQFDNSRIRSVIGPWECEIALREGLDRVGDLVMARLGEGYQPDRQLDELIDRIVDFAGF
jgi:nucleoside-diphosphate-sugar epimerase